MVDIQPWKRSTGVKTAEMNSSLTKSLLVAWKAGHILDHYLTLYQAFF